ncbi:TniB family NTP-binding protein [Aquitalea magnusonii]|uniref:TniB protein n=1 Tax=Aquitalea magnusonii TaxID=332411 RepID=A0A318JKI2_9NEIS|nr:TniB family NTP-binding protein [Aquitalea magnusonii]PXX51125.1 TniB protein [Aquitalea magnusonii]
MKYDPKRVHVLLKKIAAIRIRYPLFIAILADMDRCLAESPDLREPLCMLITGDTGVGKSTLIDTFKQLHPKQNTVEGTEIPVLEASLQLPVTIGGLFSSILDAMGAPYADRGTVEFKRRRLMELLKRCRVQLVILDEFQHLVERGTRQRIEAVADAIKSLINHSGIPFILVGMPTAHAVLEYSPQLAGRFPLRRDLPSFNWLERPADFERLLTFFEQALPFEKPSGFCDDTLPARFYLATGGNFRAFTTLIYDASRTALMRGGVRIEREQLIRSYHSLLSANRKLRANPFLGDDSAIERWIDQLRGKRQ